MAFLSIILYHLSIKYSMLSIRPAQKEDAPFIAHMILVALHIEGQDDTLAHRMLDLVNDDGTLYSWHRAFLAIDTEAHADGLPIGLCLAYDAADYHERRVKAFTMKCSDGRSAADENPSLMEQPDEAAEGEYYIDSFAVSPAYRGRGIGKLLLAHAIEQGRLKDLLPTLLVDPDNFPAVRLYTAMGFRFSHPQFAFGQVYHKYVCGEENDLPSKKRTRQ